MINPFIFLAPETVAGVAAVKAAGVSLPRTAKAAVDKAIKEMKIEGLWSKCTAVYFVVGGTSGAHAVNWKQPGTFNITWNGTVTHSVNGFTPDGSTGYGDTGLARNALDQTLLHMSSYVHTAGVNAYRGIVGMDNLSDVWTTLFNEGTSSRGRNNATSGSAVIAGDTGFTGFSRNATDDQLIRGGASFTTSTNAAPATTSTLNMWVGASNRNGGIADASDDTISFITIGDELTLAEMISLRTIANSLQAALGRAV